MKLNIARSLVSFIVILIFYSTSEDQEFIVELRKQSDRDKSLLMDENRKLTNDIEKVVLNVFAWYLYLAAKSSRGLAVMHLTQATWSWVQGSSQAVGDVRKGFWS